MALLLVNCGATEEAQQETTEESAEETTESTGKTTSAEDYDSPGLRNLRLECAGRKAEAAGEGPEALGEELGERIVRGETVTFEELLAEKGYEYTNQEAREMAEEDRKAGEQVRQEFQQQQKATGKNEAGQDISNIPKTASSAEQTACLRNYYESLPPDQRGRESQRVVAEANARGVTPYEVVGY